MKQFLQLIKPFREIRIIVALCLSVILCAGSLWAQTTINWSAADQGYENGEAITSVDFDDNVTGAFYAGDNNNAPKYYSTGSAIRCYGGNYFTISTSAGNLTSIVITFATGEGTNAITTDVGTYTNGTWSGEDQSVTFTIGGTSGHRRLASFSITYVTSAVSVAMPTFNPASGTTFGDEGLTVTISQAANKPVYYTLDGTVPTANSTLYSTPITLTSTTTIKAVAYDGSNASNVATATYTYIDPNAPGTENNPYTVAQARAAIDDNSGTQGVYATGIVSAIPTAYNTQYSNITFNFVDNAGDEVFLQAYRCGGAEAADVAVGDIVVVYGNLTKYNSTYEFAQGCTLVSLTHPAGFVQAPTFSPAAGTFSEPQAVTLSCATQGATIYYTLDGSEPDDESITYTGPIYISSTTTINAIAYLNGDASDVATATYTFVSLANISDITEVGAAYMVRGTLVATNSRGFIMGDGTGYVYYYNNGAVSQSVGDMVTVSGTTGPYGQIIQFTNTATVTEATSSNYNGTPAATLITEVPDYSQGYHLSTYLEFEGELTKNNNNYLITVGESQIQISYPTTAQANELTALNNKTVHVKGYFSGINSSSRFTIMLESVEEVVSTEPSITVELTSIAATAEATTGSVGVTYNNMETIDAEIVWYEEDGETETEYDWIAAEIDANNGVYYEIEANDGEARTAYFKVSANGVYSDLITVTQAAYVAPTVATLPFEFNGGRADIEDVDGLTQEGLGTDYAVSSNPTTRLKFDGTGDWLLLHFDGEPGKLTFDIKGNGFSDGTFTVQTSEDGHAYTELASYTELGAAQTVEFNTLGTEVRYIKWIYTEKASGNVGLGNITLAQPSTDPVITLAPASVEAPAEGAVGTLTMTTLNMSDESIFEVQFFEGDGETFAECDWITANVIENNVEYTIAANDGEARTAYLKVYGFDPDNDDAEASSNLVTFTQAAELYVSGEWVLTSLEELTENDVFVIVETKNGVSNAMSNDNGTGNAPAAVSVTVSGNTLSGAIASNIQWNIGFDEEEGYIFYPNGSESTWLYCFNDNNGVRVGTNDNKVFTISEEGYLYNVAMERYIGVFNNQDWRCYTSINNNISGQTFAFYKKVTSNAQTIALTEGFNWVSFNVEITLNDLKSALVAAAPAGSTITIKSKDENLNYLNGRWRGSLTWDLGQMYMIQVADECEIELEGYPVDPADHPVTVLGNGQITYIAFPFNESMSLTAAFNGFAVNGDIVKSKDGNSQYVRGVWRGAVTTLEPGQGYMYQSADTAADRILVFSSSKKKSSNKQNRQQ